MMRCGCAALCTTCDQTIYLDSADGTSVTHPTCPVCSAPLVRIPKDADVARFESNDGAFRGRRR